MGVRHFAELHTQQTLQIELAYEDGQHHCGMCDPRNVLWLISRNRPAQPDVTLMKARRVHKYLEGIECHLGCFFHTTGHSLASSRRHDFAKAAIASSRVPA